MTTRIRPVGPFNHDSFERSISFQQDGHDRLVVDLRRAFFVDTFAMVAILTAMNLWAETDGDIVLYLPESQSPRTYMSRMRFFQFVPESATVRGGVPEVEEHPSALVPLAPINVNEGESAINDLVGFVYPQLPPRLGRPFAVALDEVCGNVIHHAKAQLGFLAAQRFENKFQGRYPPRVQLVVADAGIGIRESLLVGEPEVEKMSDVGAIERALEERVTSQPGVHSGVGLTTVSEYADRFRGVLLIRSGEGLLVRRRGRVARRETVPYLAGTIVAVELSSAPRVS